MVEVCSIYEIHEKKWKYYEAVNQLFMDLKKAYNSVRKEVLYNILSEFGIPVKLVRLINKRLNETYGTVRLGKHLSDVFPIKDVLEKVEIYCHCFSVFL